MAVIRYHEQDISAADAARYTDAIAIDTETLGLVPRRDRLCVVQLSPGDGSADVIRIARGRRKPPISCHCSRIPAGRRSFTMAGSILPFSFIHSASPPHRSSAPRSRRA